MNKTNVYKKILFCSIVTIIATNCGGGGGGGSASVKPTTPNNVVATRPANSELEEQIIDSKNVSIVNYVEPNDNSTRTISIGIMDGDFLTDKYKIQREYENIEILENEAGFKPSGSRHAQKILRVLDGKRDIKVIAASIGEKKGEKYKLRPNLRLYKEIFKNLANEKIKIVSQSWGIAYNNSLANLKDYRPYISAAGFGKKDSVKQGEEIANFYKEKVEKDNAIFVWANGNYAFGKKTDSETKEKKHRLLNHASIQAQLPIRIPELEKGWITAVGIAPRRDVTLPNGERGYKENSHYDEHLAYPAEAKNWAVSTNGTGLYGTYGSSFAVPRVVKVAALLARKFDWMTNDEIRQIIFTTTDKPELLYNMDGTLYEGQELRYRENTADSKYGWGVLNGKRALKGPGAFHKILLGEDAKFVADLPRERISGFENDIYGEGGLRKQGEGRLLLEGENTFLGSTEIENGILDIFKGHASDVIVKNKGTLALHKKARLGKDLLSEGKVALVGYGNNAHIAGDFIATKNSIVEYEVGAKLVVDGKTRLEEPTLQVRVPGYTTTAGEEKEIIESEKVEGKFESVEVNGNRVVTVSEHSSESKQAIVIKIERGNVVSYLRDKGRLDNLEGSMIATAKNIEKVLANLDEKVEEETITEEDMELGANILELSAASLADATSKMSGEIYASAQALTFEQAGNINRNLSNHLGSLREFRKGGYEWRGWIDGLASSGKIKEKGYAKADTKIRGTQFGLDKKIDNSTQVGVAFDYSYAKADFDRYAGRFNSDGVGVSLYAKKYLPQELYLLGKVGVGRYSTRVQREILDKDLNSKNGDIKHQDRILSTYIEVGKDYEGLVPFVGYSYENLRRGSFNEEAEWGIVADAKNYNRNSIQLGIRKEYESNRNKFNGYILHSINLGDRNLDFEGRFVGSDVKENFKGIKYAKSSTWIGAGISRKVTDQFELNTKYDLKIEGKRGKTSVVSIGFKYQF